MITEDYCGFETARLLKEKGFDSDEVGCHGGFYSERCYESGYGIKTQSGQEVGIVYDDLTNSDLEYDEYLRPTLQMAMKWLRDVHGIHLAPFPYDVENGAVRYLPEILIISNETQQPEYVEGLNVCESYKQAVEVAIKYCLENLI